MLPAHGGRLVNRVLRGPEREEARRRAPRLPSLELDRERRSEVYNIAYGAFSPLQGFMGREDLEAVLHHLRLADGTPWSIPILLDVPRDLRVGPGSELCLRWEGRPLALMEVVEDYRYDLGAIARLTFGTERAAHPGVARLYRCSGRFLAGPLWLIEEAELPLSRWWLRPVETRVLFRERGWRTVVGFQTRNVPHLGHEYVQKTALTFVDGLFINPVVGRKKRGDFRDEVILEAYEALLRHYYLPGTAVLAVLPLEMRYAGPREAVLHAIVRKNFGCTHFIVGRDHAGVGDFYPPYAAQEIFERVPDLGIVPLFFRSFFWCRRCMGVVNERICPHGEEDRLSFSGTRLREMLSRGEVPPPEMMRPEVAEVVRAHPHPFVEEE